MFHWNSQCSRSYRANSQPCTDPPTAPPMQHGRGRNKTRGYKNVGDRQPESVLTTFSNHNRDHEVEPR